MHGIVYNPITMSPNNTIEDVLNVGMEKQNISGFPVLHYKANKLHLVSIIGVLIEMFDLWN